jgi:CDP-diacylglycerol--serine O-phosphatidyltransferase
MNRAWIPNSLTLGNLFCGLGAVASVALYGADAFREDHPFALFLGLALLLDVLDGWVARKLGVAGPLGLQLDSLADAVTFGAAPSLALFFVLQERNPGSAWFLSLAVAAPLALGSVYRLARFNLDTRQSDSFIGVPTPANALMVTGYLMAVVLPASDDFPLLPVTAAFSLFSAYALNAEWPLFSLKKWPATLWGLRYRLAFAASLLAALLVLDGAFAALLFVPLYLTASTLENRFP